MKRQVTMKVFLSSILWIFGLCAAFAKGVPDTRIRTHYLNFGVGGNFSVHGYSSRDTRLDFFTEVGGRWYSILADYSGGQGLSIFGLKPSFQYFIPLGTGRFSLSPALGGIINYWHEGSNASLNTLEVGSRLAVKFQFLMYPFLNFIFTPAWMDFNFWRHQWNSNSASGNSSLGHSSDLGLLYGISLSAGYSF